MPSGCAAPASMVLMSFIVFVSNIEIGLLLVKPWPDFGIDRGAIASDTGDLAGRFERVEIEDRQPCLNVRRRPRAAARDVQPASGDVRINVIPAAFSAHSGRLEYLVRAGLLGPPDRNEGRDRHCNYEAILSHRSLSRPHGGPPYHTSQQRMNAERRQTLAFNMNSSLTRTGLRSRNLQL